MNQFEPILLEDLSVALPDRLSVSRLCVHWHRPETHWVEPHAHKYPQCLLYLSGHGVQEVGEASYPVNPGRLIFVPEGVSHAFHKQERRRPVCLVVNLKFARATPAYPVSSQLTLAQQSALKTRLTDLGRLHREPEGDWRPVREAGLILDIVGILLAAASGDADVRDGTGQPFPLTGKIRKLLKQCDLREISPEKLAKQSGLQRDHLNRTLRKECGLTVGQMLAETRLSRAKELLQEDDRQIQEIGSAIGYDDRNYFARWFRQQTGQTPTAWRKLRP